MINNLIFLIFSENGERVGDYSGAAIICWCRPLEANTVTSATASNFCDGGRCHREAGCSHSEWITLWTFVWVQGSDNKRVVAVGVEASDHELGHLRSTCTVPGQGRC